MSAGVANRLAVLTDIYFVELAATAAVFLGDRAVITTETDQMTISIMIAELSKLPAEEALFFFLSAILAF